MKNSLLCAKAVNVKKLKKADKKKFEKLAKGKKLGIFIDISILKTIKKAGDSKSKTTKVTKLSKALKIKVIIKGKTLTLYLNKISIYAIGYGDENQTSSTKVNNSSKSKDSAKETKIPKTGDTKGGVLPFVAMASAAVLVGSISLRRRKRKNSQ